MNSPFANIFKKIMERIETEVPEIKYIDLDLGQLEGNSIRPAVAFPCSLVDFENFDFTNLTQHSQVAEGDVIIKLGYAQFSKSDNAIDPLWRDFALDYFDLEWKLQKALHGWSPGDEFGYLTMTNATRENKPQSIRVRTVRYRLEFEDHSTKLVQQTLTPAPPISITN